MKTMKSYQEYISELGKKIKTYRIMKDLSQEDLSDKTGIPKKGSPARDGNS